MEKDMRKLAGTLGFRAIESRWSEYGDKPWLAELLKAEEEERERRGLQTRLKEAQIGQFKPMAEFDWSWPEKIDRQQVEDLFSLSFMLGKENVILMATNGLGKSMIAQNLVYTAAMEGHSTRYVKASKMLDELLECESVAVRRRRMRKLCRVSLLAIDEVGYMSYDNRYADLLYEVISERYQKRSTIITTNTAFTEWGEIFPNAACVVTMVDRLTHQAELITVEGESYRHHEAKLLAEAKAKARKAKNSKSSKASKKEE